MLNPNKGSQSPEDQVYQMVLHLMIMSFSGIIITAFYYLQDQISGFFFRRVACSITLDNKDEIFKIVRRFLTEKGFLKGSMTQMKCNDANKKLKWWQWRRQHEESRRHKVDYLPGHGDHFFTYKGQKMWVIIQEKESISTGWDLTPSKMEQLTIYVYGNDKKYLRELVNDAITYCEEKDSSQTVIYQVHKWGGHWVKC